MIADKLKMGLTIFLFVSVFIIVGLVNITVAIVVFGLTKLYDFVEKVEKRIQKDETTL